MSIALHRLRLRETLQKAGRIEADDNVIEFNGTEYRVHNAEAFMHPRCLVERVDGLPIDDEYQLIKRLIDGLGIIGLGDGGIRYNLNRSFNDLQWVQENLPPAALASPNVELFNDELFLMMEKFNEDDDAEVRNCAAARMLFATIRLNAEYALVDKSSEPVVINQITRKLYKLTDFSNLKDNDKVLIPSVSGADSKRKVSWKEMSAVDIWRKHPMRATFDGLVFAPNGKDTDGNDVDLLRQFNIYRPSDIVPRKGDCEIIHYHFREVMCSGDLEAYDYVIGYLAHLRQFPEDKPGVALGFWSKEQGTGKGQTGKFLRNTLGRELVRSFYQKKHVVGDFAAYTVPPMLIIAEEAVFTGDPNTRNVIFAKITEDYENIEIKGKTAFEVDSFTRFVFFSNSPKALPVEEDDRRFFVSEVSNKHLRDREYFGRLTAAIKDEAVIAAFLYDLENYDLSSFEVRDIYETDAKREMRQQHFPPPIRKLAEVVREGGFEIDGSFYRLNEDEPTWIDKVHVFDYFRESVKRFRETEVDKRGVSDFLSEQQFILAARDGEKRVGRKPRNPEYQVAALAEYREWLIDKWGVNPDYLERDPTDGTASDVILRRALDAIRDARTVVLDDTDDLAEDLELTAAESAIRRRLYSENVVKVDFRQKAG